MTRCKSYEWTMSAREASTRTDDVQCFLQVGETEAVSLRSDFFDEAVWERDLLVPLQLVLPVLDVQGALLFIGIGEFAGRVEDNNW